MACVAATVVVGNLVGGLRARRSKRNFSAIPFVAAALGSLALLALPIDFAWWHYLIVVLVDYTVPMALYVLLLWVFFRRGPTARSNRRESWS